MTGAEYDQLLFTYGTLRQPQVLLDMFGRLPLSEVDVLPGHTVDYAEIADPRLADADPASVHPLLRETGNHLDRVVGTVLFVTAAELEAADEFEMTMYRRASVRLASGRDAWVYLR